MAAVVEHVTDTDESLVAAACDGSAAALDQLYRRHAEAAWRTAYSVTNNSEDAADAVSEAFLRVLGSLPEGRFPRHVPFRPYLLRAVRNAGIDVLRRRQGWLNDEDAGNLPADGEQIPEELSERRANTDLAVRAFHGLPERQRTALWLTEVEGLSAQDAASVLGVTANNAAQLASRGRTTLRSRFVQAHLSDTVPDGCRATVDRLGPMAMGSLSPAKAQAVQRHLNRCEDCRARFAELAEVRGTLSKAAPALPLALAGYIFTAWQTAVADRLESLGRLVGWGAAAVGGAGGSAYGQLKRLRQQGAQGALGSAAGAVAGALPGVGAAAAAVVVVAALIMPTTGWLNSDAQATPVPSAPAQPGGAGPREGSVAPIPQSTAQAYTASHDGVTGSGAGASEAAAGVTGSGAGGGGATAGDGPGGTETESPLAPRPAASYATRSVATTAAQRRDRAVNRPRTTPRPPTPRPGPTTGTSISTTSTSTSSPSSPPFSVIPPSSSVTTAPEVTITTSPSDTRPPVTQTTTTLPAVTTTSPSDTRPPVTRTTTTLPAVTTTPPPVSTTSPSDTRPPVTRTTTTLPAVTTTSPSDTRPPVTRTTTTISRTLPADDESPGPQV